MSRQDQTADTIDGRTVADVLSEVHLPLANANFAIDQHLLERGVWLDGETRLLLARLRDVLGDVAASTRTIARRG